MWGFRVQGSGFRGLGLLGIYLEILVDDSSDTFVGFSVKLHVKDEQSVKRSGLCGFGTQRCLEPGFRVTSFRAGGLGLTALNSTCLGFKLRASGFRGFGLGIHASGSGA